MECVILCDIFELNSKQQEVANLKFNNIFLKIQQSLNLIKIKKYFKL